MSIFKKLFSRSERDDGGNNKPNIDRLIASEDINSSIIELDNYIAGLCEHGDRLEKLNDHQKLFFFNQTVEREVNNGGFNQFYFNSSGNYAHEVVESLKRIGADKTASIVQRANDQFTENIVPKDRDERQGAIEVIESTANGVWEELDQAFYAYEDNLNSLNMEYIKKHKIDIV